jgi:hypothetical protein
MLTLPLLVLSVSLPPEAPAADPIAAIMHGMPQPDWAQVPPPRPPPSGGFIQGLLGVTELSTRNVGLDQGSWDSSDDSTMPLLGGAVQRPLRGSDRAHLGMEGGFLFGWMGNVETVIIGSGGAAVVGNNDVFLSEFFGGLYVDTMLGDKLRLYAGAGGLVDWAIVDVTYTDSVFGFVNASGSGFGLGLYTRAGFDILLQGGMRLGFCWRWFETDLDLGGHVDDLELDGMQYMLTFTKSM